MVWRLDRPVLSAQLWRNNALVDGTSASSGAGQRLGVLAHCDPDSGGVVRSWLAVSFVSVDQARENLDNEIAGRDFDTVVDDAQTEWLHQLNRVKIEGGTTEQRKIFRTALYHACAMPHDVSGENVWTDGATHYEDFYVLWDTSRMVLPLHALINPGRLGAMMQSLVEVYRSTGWMPNGRVAGHNGNTRGGTFGDLAIWDAHVKNIQGVDYATAYEALRKNALTPSPDIDTVGRADVDEYAKLGYVPAEFSVSGKFNGGRLQTSRSVEYTLCDSGIAGLAAALGHGADAELFRERTRWWTRSLDPQTQCLRPRRRDGSFVTPFDPDAATSYFYEGSARQYTTAVQHDIDHLMALLGGDTAMVSWLDALFDGGDYNPGNETDLLAPYYYINAGRHDKTVDRVRKVLEKDYRAAPFGLPSPAYGGGSGNDDSGAISAAYVWGAMGLCPNVGQPWYYLGSPIFENVLLRVGQKTFHINAVGTSDQNRYVRSATLNGRPLNRAWLLHQEIVAGGVLRLTMSDKPTGFGATGPRPPRPSTASSAIYGNIGISDDTATQLANFDGTGNSYSAQALAAAGIAPGSTVTANGVTFSWPNVPAGQLDNHAANGQRITTSGSGAISFLGSATHGPSSGTAIVTYSDGTTQSIPLTFSDWTLRRSTASPVAGNTIAAVTDTHRNTPTGAQQMKTYVFATKPVTLASGKHVTSVQLPSDVDTGMLHVFAIGFTAP
ncbi:GH92 family glycosyl hydrolase [Streptomyces sp. NPDC057582]|uniref:GH92 family glycosyl hydrolase n=1 Tax=Streptomyces sp. NPDC057582 TaxID=3346174 RepID=UPI00369C0C5A